MSQILKRRCKVTPRWLLDLENTSLEQNLRLKNLGYFSLSLLFFYLLSGCHMVNFWLLLRKQSHSPDDNHCISSIIFWSNCDLEGFGSLHLIDHNGITHLGTHHKLKKILSPDLNQDFQNVEMSPIPKTVIA